MILPDAVLENKKYRINKNIVTTEIGNFIVYIDSAHNRFIKVPLFIHDLLLSGNMEQVKDTLAWKYMEVILDKLLSNRYITESCENVPIGKTFFMTVQDSRTMALRAMYGLKYIMLDTKSIERLEEARRSGYIGGDTVLQVIIDDGEAAEDTLRACMEAADVLFIESCSVLKRIMEMDFQFAKRVIFQISGEKIGAEGIEVLRQAAASGLKIQFALRYFNGGMTDELAAFLQLPEVKSRVYYDYCDYFSHNPPSEIGETGDAGFVSQNDLPLKRIAVSCGAGVNKFYIDKEGDIFSCVRMKNGHSIGNIFAASGNEFIAGMIMKGNKSVKQGCAECNIRYFCAGGCMADELSGELPYCHLIKERIINRITAG